MAKATKNEVKPLVIPAVSVGQVEVWLRGSSPLIFNCMSEKARRELLYPSKRTRADRDQSLKHEPLEEYRASVYRTIDAGGETLLVMPSTAIKAALMASALEVPDVYKSQIGRLIWVQGAEAPVWGVPQVLMSVVRSAGMNRTPDIRTRAILPQWCCRAAIRFVQPTVNETVVANLLNMAGLVIGLGDFRQEKGKGSFGQFELCEASDVQALIKSGGRAAQEKALNEPSFYDHETRQLYTWYVAEQQRRGEKNKTAAAKARVKAAAG